MSAARTFAPTMAGLLFGFTLTGCVSAGFAPSISRDARLEEPRPALGLWAIVDPGCETPTHGDVRAWPKCASPFWMDHPSGWVAQGPRHRSGRGHVSGYRADVRLMAGEPLIVRVGTAHDGYVFLALTRIGYDSEGRMIGAVGAPFGCFDDTPGPIHLNPTAGGCDKASADGMRRAAKTTLRDNTSLSRLAWVGPGTP